MQTAASPPTFPRTIRYHAVVAAPKGRRLVEVIVERDMLAPGRCAAMRETPTGRTFKSQREAAAALVAANCAARAV